MIKSPDSYNSGKRVEEELIDNGDFIERSTDSMPYCFGTFNVNYVAAEVTRMALSRRKRRDSRSCMKCFLLLMYNGSVSTRGCKMWVSRV